MPLMPSLSQKTSVRRVSMTAEIDEIAEDWNRLAAETPFCRHEWLAAWWRHYEQPGQEAFVLVVCDDDGAVAGLAPWYRRDAAFSGRTLAFLGSGEVCSDYVTVLAAAEQSERVAEALADWLFGEGRDEWDTIELDGIDQPTVEQETSAIAALLRKLRSRGCLVHQRQRIGAWRLELPGDWKTYASRLSKSRRGAVRTIERRYFETGRAVVRAAESTSDVERGLAILHDLHQRRRESLGDAGCFASPRFAAFLTDAAGRFHALGHLRLQWIELDGRPVAAEFDLSSNDTVFHYQSGIDPDAMQDRPGWLMQISALKLAIEQEYRAFDFLRGDEPYKSWWRAERRPLVELRIVAPRFSARLRHGAWSAGVRSKTWLKGLSDWAKQRQKPRSDNAGSNN